MSSMFEPHCPDCGEEKMRAGHICPPRATLEQWNEDVPEKFTARISRGGTVLIPWENDIAHAEGWCEQSQFVLRAEGTVVTLQWIQGDLLMEKVPKSLWTKIWTTLFMEGVRHDQFPF